MNVFNEGGTSNSGGVDLGALMRIGVQEVDQLHSELARLIERVNEDPQALTSSESVADLLSSLQNLLVKEFAIEEKLMVDNNVPADQLAEHISEHTALLSLFVEASIDAMTKNYSTARQLYGTIRTQVLEHTLKHDVKLS